MLASSSAASLDSLRAALLPNPSTDFISENHGDQDAATPAAILFPIVLRPERLTVLLTQRTDHLKDHPGQVSFPGGRVEVYDPSPLETALRETEEEIGLDRSRVDVLGYLPEYRTGTGFRVVPVVGTVRPPFSLRLDPIEVADVFEVPLDFLLDASNHQPMSIHVDGRRRSFYSMPYGERFIWGATAGMIRSLYDRMNSASR
jgi:8-oxo-dGTP pyrophosphatase MutT (NUDIX family)